MASQSSPSKSPLPLTATELRCGNFLHGILHDEIIEIKCRKSFCRPAPGVVVLHQFSARTGELLNTKYYRDPGSE